MIYRCKAKTCVLYSVTSRLRRSKSFLPHFPCPWTYSCHADSLILFSFWADLYCNLPAVEQAYPQKGRAKSLTLPCPLRKTLFAIELLLTPTISVCFAKRRSKILTLSDFELHLNPMTLQPRGKSLYLQKTFSHFRKNSLTLFVIRSSYSDFWHDFMFWFPKPLKSLLCCAVRAMLQMVKLFAHNVL